MAELPVAIACRRVAVFAAALALDLVLGEPPAWAHPVVWMGMAIGAWQKALTPRPPLPMLGEGVPDSSAVERGSPLPALGEGSGVRALCQLLHGAAITILLPTTSALLAAAVPHVPLPKHVRFAAEVWLLKSMFAARALLEAAEGVRRPLQYGELREARMGLRALVSRDTSELSSALVAAAAIESLAENLTDSALAPWLAYAVLGLPGAAAYRALNTLDSMIGYRGRYEYLGRAAARADDAANLLPARLGALLIAAAAPIGPGSAGRALRTARAHHRRTASPNAGWTMAAMAGALGVTLEKVGAYRLGVGRQPHLSDIRRAEWIVAAALALSATACGALTILMDRGWRTHANARRRARGRTGGPGQAAG